MISTDIRLRENYVNTLWELAKEEQVVTTVKEDLEAIDGIIEEQNDLGRFLASPYFPRQSKLQLIANTLSAAISELTMSFLGVLIKHNRMGLLRQVTLRYRQLWDAEHHHYTVKITVARPLAQGQAEELTTAIGQAVGGTIKLEVAVDPRILGGAIIRCGDKVIDNSVSDRLQTAVRTILNQVKGRAKQFQ